MKTGERMRCNEADYYGLCCAWLMVCPAGGDGAKRLSERPVRLLVGFGAGSAADLIARVLSQQLSKTFGQAFVVENKPGGGSTVAARSRRPLAEGWLHAVCR